MTVSCDWVEEQLPAYALDALSADERAQVRAHLETCPRCAALAREYLAAAQAPASGAPARQPPARLRAAILKQAEASKAPQPAPGGRGLVARFALVALLALGGGAAWFVATRDNERVIRERVIANSTVSVPLRGHEERAPSASGRIVYRPGDRVAVIELDKMPEAPPGRAYCLWLVYDDGQARDVGAFFKIGADGRAQLLINAPRPLDSYQRFGISDEPEGPQAPNKPSGKRYIGS
jgi:anti-sigma-K factor RskA